jgi:hypothetical protein
MSGQWAPVRAGNTRQAGSNPKAAATVFRAEADIRPGQVVTVRRADMDLVLTALDRLT